MRIIGISGVWSNRNAIWLRLGPAFTKKFRKSWFAAEELVDCNPWETARMREFVEKLALKYDDATPTLLVGHSMGGLMACSLAHSLPRNPIAGVVTVFSPHTYMLGAFSRSIDVPRDIRAPVVSFEATRDILVPWGARHPQSVSHTVLRSNHLSDVVESEHLAETIAEVAHAHLKKT